MARTATKVRFTEPGEQKDGGLFVEEEEEGSIEKVCPDIFGVYTNCETITWKCLLPQEINKVIEKAAAEERAEKENDATTTDADGDGKAKEQEKLIGNNQSNHTSPSNSTTKLPITVNATVTEESKAEVEPNEKMVNNDETTKPNIKPLVSRISLKCKQF